jgi:hypothetical protein
LAGVSLMKNVARPTAMVDCREFSKCQFGQPG